MLDKNASAVTEGAKKLSFWAKPLAQKGIGAHITRGHLGAAAGGAMLYHGGRKVVGDFSRGHRERVYDKMQRKMQMSGGH